AWAGVPAENSNVHDALSAAATVTAAEVSAATGQWQKLEPVAGTTASRSTDGEEMSTTSETFVALGAIDPALATPFLASGQRLVLDPTDEELATADAAIVRAAFTVDKAMLDRMPALKVLARTGVGTDLVEVAEADRRGIPVVITPGSNTSAVAEGVFAHLLAAVKRLSTLTALVGEGRWDERGAVTVGDLDGKTLGIVGFGRIGRRAASIAAAFDMRVRAYDPYVEVAAEYRCDSVEELLAASGVMTLNGTMTGA